MEQEKKQKPLLQEMAELKEKVENIGIKRKKMRIPRKAKVKKGKVKKGWIGIIRIDENGNLSGERLPDNRRYPLGNGDIFAGNPEDSQVPLR